MPNETNIPADAIAGLLVGWTGPVEYRDALGEWGPTCCDNGRWLGVAVHMDPDRIRLNCLRPEVQARVGSVLAAGVRCPACDPANCPCRKSHCRRCDGTTYLRKPSPIHHLTDAIRTGALSNQHIAEAVAWSVRSVARGGEVLRGVYVGPSSIDGKWYRITGDGPDTFGWASAVLAANCGYIDGGALVLPGEQS